MAKTYHEIEIARFNRILERLSDASMLNLDEFALFIIVPDGTDETFFEKASSMTGVDIVWTSQKGPKWLNGLSSLLPMHTGMMEITEPARLKTLFGELALTGKTEIAYVRRSFAPTISEAEMLEDANMKTLLETEKEYVYLKAQMDDFVQHEPAFYYVYDYVVGDDTAAVLKTVFNELTNHA